MNFSATCTFRSFVETFAWAETRLLDVMNPKSPERGLVTGSPSKGWLRTLKASNRNSEPTRSVIRNLLKIDASKLANLGPLMIPSPAFPNVPTLGNAKPPG